MEKNISVKNIPPEMLSTHRMLKCAFPTGIDPAEYLAVLAVLGEIMSMRRVAEAMAHYTDKGTYLLYYNDVLHALSDEGPTPEAIEQVKQRLLPCGYNEWLAEE